MAGKRQHFIPQMLLQHFADSQGGVWVGRRDGTVHGSKVDGVALEGMFYLEDAGRVAIGRASRRASATPVELERMFEAHLPNTVAMIAGELDALAPRQGGPVGLAVFRGSPARAWAIELAKRKLPDELRRRMPEALSVGEEFVRAIASNLVPMVKGAHSKTALESPTPGPRVEALSQFSFAVEEHHALILGDAVAWGVRPGIGCCPLFSMEDDIECVVMPVGRTRILHGWKGPRKLLGHDVINSNSAIASREFVLASSEGPEVHGFLSRIGTGTATALQELRGTLP